MKPVRWWGARITGKWRVRRKTGRKRSGMCRCRTSRFRAVLASRKGGPHRLRHGDTSSKSRAWGRGSVAATPERAIWAGASKGEQEALRKGWFHGFDLCERHHAGLGSYIAASSCPARSRFRLRPSGGASEGGCDVMPVYRDLRQLQNAIWG